MHKLPASLDDFDVCRLIYQLMADSGSEDVPGTGMPILSDMFMIQREKLKDFNTLEQCVELISRSKNIIVLTGAGCSVSCGIPDFRSRDGVYARLRVDFPDLPDPQAMFDIFYFDHDPRPFFKFAKEIYPGQFKPSLSHMFIKKLEENQKLLRNYTQNIDTLEMTAGIKNVIQCHGSFATATCTTCKLQVDADHIRVKIMNQEIPYCEVCKVNEKPVIEEATTKLPITSSDELVVVSNLEAVVIDNESNEANTVDTDYDPLNEDTTESSTIPFAYKKNNSAGILKPDIVFFGEGLPEHYHESIGEDKSKCDLLIVIGSSLKVKPVANIPHLLPQTVPQILINRESLKHMNFDIELLGDCDVIVNELLLRLQKLQPQSSETQTIPSETPGEKWSEICSNQQTLSEISGEEAETLLFASDSPSASPDISTVIMNVEPTTATTSMKKETDQVLDSNHMAIKKYTTDYLRTNSYLYLKPNMYVFHGAELQLKHARKKLRRLNLVETQTNATENESSESDLDDSDDSDNSDLTDDSDESDSDLNADDLDAENVAEKLNTEEGVDNNNKSSDGLMKFFDGQEGSDSSDGDEDFNPEASLGGKKELEEFIGDKLPHV